MAAHQVCEGGVVDGLDAHALTSHGPHSPIKALTWMGTLVPCAEYVNRHKSRCRISSRLTYLPFVWSGPRFACSPWDVRCVGSSHGRTPAGGRRPTRVEHGVQRADGPADPDGREAARRAQP